MKSSQYSGVSNTAETVVDLAAIDPWQATNIYIPCLFIVEVSGNDAEVTITARGPFDTSAVFDIAEGTIPVGGAVKLIDDAALSQLIFTRTGTTEYNINIIRTPVN